MDVIAKDKRFAQIANDPRFHKMKRHDRKVKIDKRFHGMFKDKRFKLKYTVDKRGRPIRATTNENLHKYYDLSESESDSVNSDDEAEGTKKQKKKTKKERTKEAKPADKYTSQKKTKTAMSAMSKHSRDESGEGTGIQLDISLKKKAKKVVLEEESESNDSQEGDEDVHNDDREEEEDGDNDFKDEADTESEEEETETESESEDDTKASRGLDLARGEGNIQSSTDEDDDDDDDNDDDDNFVDGQYDHGWGELDKTAPPAEEITHRLAVCNMDWDRIKAQDLFVLFSSFTSAGSSIKSVTIYPSEYGLKRLAEEDVKGPIELVEKREDDDKFDGDASQVEREKLRQYQLNRLRYYYALLECDSKETANKIYEDCDGIEYESSATRLDLRFVPDGMVFDQKPKSVASSLPDTTIYKPTLFKNTALQQSRVDLTWDETDQDRIAVTMRKFTKEDLEELDVRDYLASSSGSEDEGDPYGGFIEQPDFGEAPEAEDEETTLAKYHELIKGVQDTKEKEKESKGKGMELEITWDPGLMNSMERAAQKKAGSPWEQFLEKKKEKKGKKKTKSKNTKEESESEAQEGGETEGATFSDDELPSDLDLGDDYFKEEQGAQGNGKKPQKTSKKTKKKHLTAEEEVERRRQEAKLSMMLMDEDDNRQHFSMKGIMAGEAATTSKAKRKKLQKMKKKQGASQVEDTFKIDVSDPRFGDVFDNPLFNIDPSAPEYKATNATKTLIDEKMRRRREKSSNGTAIKTKRSAADGSTDALPAKQARWSTELNPAKTKDLSLASLVKSVKAKTLSLQNKKTKCK